MRNETSDFLKQEALCEDEEETAKNRGTGGRGEEQTEKLEVSVKAALGGTV